MQNTVYFICIEMKLKSIHIIRYGFSCQNSEKYITAFLWYYFATDLE